MGVASWPSRHVTHLRRCRLNFMNVLFEGVCNLGRVLLALAVWTYMSASISTMTTNLSGWWVCRCLVLQTLFRRSLWRAVHLGIISRIVMIIIWGSMMVAGTTGTFVLSTVARVVCLIIAKVTALVQMLLIVRCASVPRSSTSRCTILVANTTILWCRCIVMAGTISFLATLHMRCLWATTLDFICREFF